MARQGDVSHVENQDDARSVAFASLAGDDDRPRSHSPGQSKVAASATPAFGFPIGSRGQAAEAEAAALRAELARLRGNSPT